MDSANSDLSCSRRQPGGPRQERRHTPKVDTSGLYQRAIREAFIKLDPRTQVKNPVMLVVWLGTIITALMTINPNLFGPTPGENLRFFNGLITAILFFTVVFANFAEAVAEGRGKAQADALRATKSDTMDIVARITGVVVRERVPDRMLDDADEVVVVDVTPETLEERLLDGKIYAPEKIQQSLGNFFQRRNLLALRELALREVADCLEEDALAITPPTGKTCNIHERVMVCLSTYPNSLQLLRRGVRVADQMNAKLYALYVADPERFLTKEQSLLLETCEQLCREFDGEFLRVESSSIPETIAKVAQEKHITQIVMGESQRSRWKLLLQGSFTQQLTRLLKDQEIDLHVIAADRTSAVKPRES